MAVLQHTKRVDLDTRVATLKQQQRSVDARDLATGRRTALEINRKNGLFSGRGLVLDLASGGRFR